MTSMGQQARDRAAVSRPATARRPPAGRRPLTGVRTHPEGVR
ncbi:hypothetical protein [Streptoalloteichus tenebrarius]